MNSFTRRNRSGKNQTHLIAQCTGVLYILNCAFNQNINTMQFDANNNVVKLCAKGMDLEGKRRKKEALELFQQAWNQATNNFEKFTSAHYVARHQETIEEKLKWDKTALHLALKINDDNVKELLRPCI